MLISKCSALTENRPIDDVRIRNTHFDRMGVVADGRDVHGDFFISEDDVTIFQKCGLGAIVL